MSLSTACPDTIAICGLIETFLYNELYRFSVMFSLDDPAVEVFLNKWFGSGEHQFGQFRNQIYTDLQGYKHFIKTCIEREVPAFHSVEPKLTISKIFWEFDMKEEFENRTHLSPELDILWEEVECLVLKILKIGAYPLITYSGSRGFHVWVFTHAIKFEPKYESFARIFYKELLFTILGDDEFVHFDRIPTHINALARIPFSFHQKTKNQVIPLTLERKPYIPDLDKFFKKHSLSKDFLTGVYNHAKEIQNERERKIKTIKFDNTEIRPCIVANLQEAPQHNSRLAYLLDAIYCKMADEEVHAFMKTLQHQYDYEKTQYQIDYARTQVQEEGLLPVSKETLRRWKICTDEMCAECKCKQCKPRYAGVWET